MAWCPVCKNEYRKGFTTCSDCKVDLVESLDDIKDVELDNVDDVMDTEDVVDTTDTSDIDDVTGVMDLDMMTGDIELDEQGAELASEFEEIQDDEDREFGSVFEDKYHKSSEHKSSAFALLIVSVLGAVALLLNEFNMLPFHVEFASKGMVYGVLFGMFFLFFAAGIYSFMQSKKLGAEAVVEEEYMNKVRKYMEENLTKKFVGEKIGDIENKSEEQVYFLRINVIKRLVEDEFFGIESSMLEMLVDEYYDKQYGEM